MADATKMRVGVCTVVFNGVDLGHTQGGVEVTYEPTYHDMMVDKFGETVVEKKLIGEKLTAKVPLAEYTIANLKAAMPQGQYAGVANARIHVGKSAGAGALTNSAQLVLHPQNEGTRAYDVVFHKAYVAATITLPHKNDEDKIIEVEFVALVDESKSDNNYLGFIGDSTA
jgi:hypothetical protein